MSLTNAKMKTLQIKEDKEKIRFDNVQILLKLLKIWVNCNFMKNRIFICDASSQIQTTSKKNTFPFLF